MYTNNWWISKQTEMKGSNSRRFSWKWLSRRKKDFFFFLAVVEYSEKWAFFLFTNLNIITMLYSEGKVFTYIKHSAWFSHSSKKMKSTKIISCVNTPLNRLCLWTIRVQSIFIQWQFCINLQLWMGSCNMSWQWSQN